MHPVRQAQDRMRAAGRPGLAIGVVEGEKTKATDAQFVEVLTRLCLLRPIRELWIARDVWPMDAVQDWAKEAGVAMQTCSRYVALTVADKLDGFVAVRAEEWLVKRLREEGRAVWVPRIIPDASASRTSS